MGPIYKCDFCKCTIDSDDISISFGIVGIGIGRYDACETCTKTIRTAVCKECHGKGTLSVRDAAATNSMASCGENRTQYKTIECNCCN